jgi:hypothetical protein
MFVTTAGSTASCHKASERPILIVFEHVGLCYDILMHLMSGMEAGAYYWRGVFIHAAIPTKRL